MIRVCLHASTLTCSDFLPCFLGWEKKWLILVFTQDKTSSFFVGDWQAHLFNWRYTNSWDSMKIQNQLCNIISGRSSFWGFLYNTVIDYWWGVLHKLRLLAAERKPMMHSSVPEEIYGSQIYPFQSFSCQTTKCQ